MKLALSNLAWESETSDLIFNTIKSQNINNIECVLTKINHWSKLNNDDIFKFKEKLNDIKIYPESIQSLFYNSGCEDITETKKIINHFNKVIDYAKILNSKILVFGSPNLRKRKIGWEKSINTIFKEIDDSLNNTNIKIAIEPNSSIYGSEFFVNIFEIVQFIEKNKFNNIGTMIDTHNIMLENKSPINELNDFFNYIIHIHISEKKLKNIKNIKQHLNLADKINELNYDGIITYEVKNNKNLISSIKKFSTIYNLNI
jgi:sugar phosphate isomerase/epimerase